MNQSRHTKALSRQQAKGLMNAEEETNPLILIPEGIHPSLELLGKEQLMLVKGFSIDGGGPVLVNGPTQCLRAWNLFVAGLLQNL